MASTVVSKNLYELLGNDHEYDSDKEPEPETKTVAAKSTRTTKRNADETAPAIAPEQADRGGQKARRGGAYGGSEGAFRDRAAGRTANEGKPTDDGLRQDRHSHGGGRGYDRFGPGSRGGRGGRGNHHKDDRHSRGVPNDHVKQGDAAWGAATGEAELNDEVEGEKIAREEAKEGHDTTVDAPVDADGNKLDEKEPEPEDNSKSYADYLIEQAEKKLSLAAVPEARKPNEGSKPNKKWDTAKQFTSTKTEEEAYFSAPAREKAAREKKQPSKQVVDIDHRFVEQPRAERGGRGGRGGDRSRGGERGRGDSTRGGEGRGRGGRGRGEFRGRGDRPRGEFRGASGRGANVNITDESAFPSLGGN